jgi:hypothetical protein
LSAATCDPYASPVSQPRPTHQRDRAASDELDTRKPDTLFDEHRATRHMILDRCPALREAAALVSSFAVIMVNL